MEKLIIIIAASIQAITAVVIACYAFKSHKLSKQIIKEDKEFKQQIKDLYNAIAISNLCSGNLSIHTNINTFKEHYKGETRILQ